MSPKNLVNGSSYFIFSFFICGECVLVSVSSASISLPIQAAGQVFQKGFFYFIFFMFYFYS